MECPEMHSTSRCRNPTYLLGPVNYPISRGGGIGPRMETCVNWGGPIAMVPCLHQDNVYIKRKLWVRRTQTCIPLIVTEIPLTCAGRQTTSSHVGRYKAESGNLHKLGCTYCHGTMFTPKQCLYRKEAMGMESPEWYSTSSSRDHTCVGPQGH